MGKMSVKFLCCGLSKFLLREEQEKFVIAKEWFTLWWQGVGRGRREGACCDCWMANGSRRLLAEYKVDGEDDL